MTTRPKNTRSAFSLIELMISLTIFSILMGAILYSVNRNTSALGSLAHMSEMDMRASEMIARLRKELASAQGAVPTGILTATLDAGTTGTVQLSTIAGFPDRGTLLVDRGTGSEERIAYQGFDPALPGLQTLTRGVRCTAAATHVAGATAYWAGIAEPIENQISPAASEYDGRCREFAGPVYFRGDGSGFSYRTPVDPAGGTNYIVGGEVQWGATVSGQPTTDGWSAILFVPDSVLVEAVLGADLNQDGDTLDTFDQGKIRKRSWNGQDANWAVTDTGLCPSIILQEQCNWGGDLDNDGFDDPIFFWDPDLQKLHIRLFVLSGTVNSTPVVQPVESVLFLRNSTS